MNRRLLITGIILGALAIILGAFAAHGLEKLVDTKAIKSFETGVRYQMYHAFLFLILGATHFLNENFKTIIYGLVVAGIILFSGSIYGLATNSLFDFNFEIFALLTPLGGVLLIGAWLTMLVGLIKNKKNN